MANQKGLLFNTNVSPDIPEIVVQDRTKLGQVIVNILTNAVKFTVEG